MTTLKISSKGQVTLDAAMLRHLNAQPGDSLDLALLPGGKLQVSSVPSNGIESVFGILSGKTSKKSTIAEIRTVAAEGWSGEHR